MSSVDVVRIRQIRHERSHFDGRFYEKHPDYWPIARAAATFKDRPDWPAVAEYEAAFEGAPPVRFAPAAPRKRRARPGPRPEIARGDLYDAMIVGRRVVPTRPAMWHDYLNALVWATFPRAKLALHERQHAAIERWLPPGATQLPNARTRELDALALLDEGGVLVLDDGEGAQSGRTVSVHFGHALFEGLVMGQPAMVARALVLPVPGGSSDAIATADAGLAAWLADRSRLCTPDELLRIPVATSSATGGGDGASQPLVRSAM